MGDPNSGNVYVVDDVEYHHHMSLGVNEKQYRMVFAPDRTTKILWARYKAWVNDEGEIESDETFVVLNEAEEKELMEEVGWLVQVITSTRSASRFEA